MRWFFMGVQTQRWQGNPFDCLSVDVNSRANLSKSKRGDGKDRIFCCRGRTSVRERLSRTGGAPSPPQPSP